MSEMTGWRVEPLGTADMMRVAAGEGWPYPVELPIAGWIRSAIRVFVTTAPASSYAYGKVGYTS